MVLRDAGMRVNDGRKLDHKTLEAMRLGLTPQRLVCRAYQADPQAQERWRQVEYPAIVARAKATGSVILIVDNHRVHHSKAVRAWVESTNGAFTLAFLPPY